MLMLIIIVWLVWACCRPRYGGVFGPIIWNRRPPVRRRSPWMGGWGHAPMGGFGSWHHPPMGGFRHSPMGGFSGGRVFGGGGHTMGGGAGRGRR